MKGFDETSKGIFELIFTSPLQPINYRFLYDRLSLGLNKTLMAEKLPVTVSAFQLTN